MCSFAHTTMCVDSSVEYLQGLSGNDTTGWILLHHSMQGVHRWEDMTGERLLEYESVPCSLREALGAESCLDLRSTLRDQAVRALGADSDTDADDEDMIVHAAEALVSAVKHSRSGLVQAISRCVGLVDVLEEQHGLRHKVEGLSDDDRALCMTRLSLS